MSEKLETMRKIADWLTEHGWDVYYDQKNEDGYNTFHANTGSKPDLLLRKNGYNILIEVKPCQKHKDLLDGMDQTIEYTGEYYTGRTKYHVDDPEENIGIDAFVLATDNSKFGYLYQDEASLQYTENSYLSKQKNLIEKPITHSATRFLWRQWGDGLAHEHYEVIRANKAGKGTVLPPFKPKIGTLLAKTEKDTRQTNGVPHLFLNPNEFIPMSGETLPVFH